MEQIKKTKSEGIESEIPKFSEGQNKNLLANKINILSRLGKAMIYLLVFLLPVFFLPWTSNVLDFNKQALLLVLVFLSFICWLARGLISGKVEINTSFLNLPVIILFLVSIVSVILSVFRYGSFWGWPLPVSQSFVTLLGFVVFYFLIANFFKKDEIVLLFLVFFLSGFLSSLFFILQLFGRFILPFDFTKTISFNTIGTVNSLAVFNSLLLLLLLPLLFFVKRFFKFILGIFAFTSLITLFLINFKIAWMVFLTGIAVLFIFGVLNLRKTGQSGFITAMMVFLMIALFFNLLRFQLPGFPAVPLEVSVSQKTELGILKQLPLRELFLGSGPGTFIYKWSEHKPADLNQTVFWATRFGNGASEILDRIITTGILGILAFFFLIFIFLKQVFHYLVKKMDESPERSKISDGAIWFLSVGMMSSFLGLVVGFILYPANFSIFLIFWLLIGSLAILDADKLTEENRIFGAKRKTFEISASPTKSLTFSFLFVLILILGIGFCFYYLQKYAAETRYSQGLKYFQKGNLASAGNYVSRAVNLHPQMDIYWRDLSQIYLFNLNEILFKNDLTSQEKNNQVQTVVSSAIGSANQATILNPRDVANWNVRGFVYASMIGILQGAEDWAISCYETAAELEPTNPYIFTEMGRIYISKADLASQQNNLQIQEESFGLAKASLEKALSLKPDYAVANYQSALIYVREGKTKEAIEKLELARWAAPEDIGLAFQLGVLYYNDNQLDKAKDELKRAVGLDPKYSNARYFLGLIYDREENKKEAILQFEEIEKFNPDNQEIKKILSNLRAGLPALEGVVPSQPPIEEKAPEQLEK